MKYSTLTKKNKGFALIATISVMVLLVMIALAMLSLSTIEVRQSRNASHQATAQANARMALMIAIGQLQEYAGPDQRVTALAEIKGTTNVNGKWTGVWSTTSLNDVSAPMVGGYENGLYFTDKRSFDTTLNDGKWKDALHLGWLVSGNPSEPSFNGDSVELVGSGSLGSYKNDKNRVSAPLVKILGKDDTVKGGYAYWVSDESQKARIDIASTNSQPNLSSPQAGGYYRLFGTGGVGLSDVKAGETRPYAAIDTMPPKDKQKIITPNTIGLAANDNSLNKSIKANFHDLTTRSYTVLADVRAGGLMKDLTDYLQQPSGIRLAAGIVETDMPLDQPIIPGDKYKVLGPNFQHFKNWYKLGDLVSGSLANGRSIEPQLIPSRADNEGNYTEYQTSDISKKSQPVQPVLAGVRLAFDFSRDSARAEGRAIRAHLYPRVTLWNPYNVILKGARYIVACSLPAARNLQVENKIAVNIAGPNSGKIWGPVVGNLVYFVTSPIDMNPGECLVFSPDYSASGSPKLGGNSARYDHTNISNNVLSARIPTGQNNFYIDSGKAADASVSITPVSPIPYGYPNNNVNAGFTNQAMYYMLKKAPTTGSLDFNTARTRPSISSLLLEPAGKRRYGWWFVYKQNNYPVNNATLPGFAEYTASPNRNPPRLWYQEARLRWLDEFDELQSLGQTWGKGAGMLYHNPVVGNFNIRSPYIHRSPYSYYNDWTRYAPGPSMMPWASPRLGDPRNQLPYRNSKSYGSPFGLPDDWGAIKSYAMFDIPNKDIPIFSLASLQHAQLGFQGWQPSYIVGHSNAEPRSDRDATVSRSFFAKSINGTAWGPNLSKNGNNGTWSHIIYNQNNAILCYDITYSVNQQLWDRYFLSTRPKTASFDPLSQTLPNSRLIVANSGGLSDSKIKDNLSSGKSFNYAAYHLMNKGAFNVNSTSVEAWRALFSMLGNVSRPDGKGGQSSHTFSRLLVPTDSQSTGTQGGNASETKRAATWEGVRTLTDTEIDTLAKEMVKIVKKRGPFLSLSDFVNRRLGKTTENSSSSLQFDDATFCGPLQAAIEKAKLNTSLQKRGAGNIPIDEIKTDMGGANTGGGARPDAISYFPYKTYGAPGYLTQADILQTIAPSLTARGDTFVIRAYGESRDRSGQVLSRAWCEATVQRTPDYLAASSPDSPSSPRGNNPLEPVTIQSSTILKLSANSKLLPINVKFGRRFKIVDFRWLSKSEI